MSLSSDQAFTCRYWKLNLFGCPDGLTCRYSHRDTGMMSPAINLTCKSWKAGCCQEDQDQCLYLHADLNTSATRQSASHPPEHARSSQNKVMIDLTGDDTGPSNDLTSDKPATAKIPCPPDVPGITQPEQQSKNPIIPSQPHPQSPSTIQDQPKSQKRIRSPKQRTLKKFTTKAEFAKILSRLQQNELNLNAIRGILEAVQKADTDLHDDKGIHNDLLDFKDFLWVIEEQTKKAITMMRKKYSIETY